MGSLRHGRVVCARAQNVRSDNLPRLPSFFGRVEELKQIADALDPESRTWAALIAGPGGMGKTSLAVRAAYDCTPAQFDRIIFLSLKDRGMEGEGERRLTGLLLDALPPTRVLIVFDNLESLSKADRDQILTLVKRLPQGCGCADVPPELPAGQRSARVRVRRPRW